jgi:hypothetical protein
VDSRISHERRQRCTASRSQDRGGAIALGAH